MLGMNASSPNGSQLLGPNGSEALAALVLNVSGNASAIGASTSHANFVAVPSPFMLHSVLAMAIVANSLLYISPLSTAWGALKEQVELKSLASWLGPTYFIFAQSYLWACYGYSTGLTDLARFNAFGAIVCISYLCMIARCARPREVAQPLILLSIAAMLASSVAVALVCSSSVRSSAFGYSATIFNLGMILAPVPEALKVLQSGIMEEDFPLAITVASFFSSLFWAQYSLLVNDYLYLLPNLVGTVVGAVELFLIYWTVWGGGATAGAQSLLEVGNQPLMPRLRGKNGKNNCGNFLHFFSFGTKAFSSKPWCQTWEGSLNKDGEFGLDAVRARLREKTKFGTFARVPSTAKVPTAVGFGACLTKKSPFSAFDHPEGLENPAARDEPEFEPQGTLDNNMQRDEFAFIDGETYRPCGGPMFGSVSAAGRHGSYLNLGSSGGIDCIL